MLSARVVGHDLDAQLLETRGTFATLLLAMDVRTTFCSAACALALGILAHPAAAQPAPNKPAPNKPAPDKVKPDCPPGAYCEEAEVEPPPELTAPRKAPDGPAGAEGETVVIPPPPPGADPNAPRVLVVRPDPDGGPGQVVIYEPGTHPPEVPGMEEPVRPVPPPPPPPPKKRWRRHREWGLNLRLDGFFVPRYRSDVGGAGLVGLGLSLRYRPIKLFAVDVAADFLAGSDANGYDRQEIPFGLSAMVYPNPDDLAQFYAFGGINWAFARVFSDVYQPHLSGNTSDEYTYFGGHLGLGIEFRVSALVGINIDGMAVIRTRTDSDEGGRYPEFYNPGTQEGSNTSAGGMLRGGVTFWW